MEAIETALAGIEGPVLVVSSLVGRGSFSLGEAVAERLAGTVAVRHVPIEQFSSPDVVREDTERYRRIVSRYPWLLYVIYGVRLVYYRKYLREKFRPAADLSRLAACVDETGARTVIGISHRPTFWLSTLKRRRGGGFCVVGLATDYGATNAWRYLFWEQIDRFLTGASTAAARLPLPASVRVHHVELPARRRFEALAREPGDPRQTLLMCGFWALGPVAGIVDTLAALIRVAPATTVHVACGDNTALKDELSRRFDGEPRVRPFAGVTDLLPLYRACASVITKPGLSSLLEARAARRQIFLLDGLPVTEALNARHARAHFGARPFAPPAFAAWQSAALAGEAAA